MAPVAVLSDQSGRSICDIVDSDCLSISDSSDDSPSLVPRLPIFDQVLSQLLSEFRRVGCPQGESGRDNGSHLNLINRPVNASPTSTRIGRKRKKEDDRDGNDEDGDGILQPPNKKSSHRLMATKVFACPFWKWDPNKHLNCYKYRLARIRDVKQHLARKHTPTYYCDCCFAIFSDAADHDEHVTHRNGVYCQRDPLAQLDGISTHQSRELSRKSSSKMSDIEQWFKIWDIIFPSTPRPSSAYLDAEFSEDLCAFREWAERRAPEILAEEIEAHAAWSTMEMSAEERGRHLRRIIQVGMCQVGNDWFSRRLSREESSMSSNGGTASNDGGQPASIIQTTSDDSGVAIGTSSELPPFPFDPLNLSFFYAGDEIQPNDGEIEHLVAHGLVQAEDELYFDEAFQNRSYRMENFES